MNKRIIVLGAGYAGILTAKKLAKMLKDQKVDITIIDKNPFHTMLTELHEVAAWRVEEESIRIDLKKVFAGRNVDVVLDTITETNFESKTLVGKNKTYNYDFLVMASGCKSTYFGVKGAEENSFPLWSYDEAVRLREHIMNMFREAAKETDPARKKALLTFYVIGAGFTGVEMIGELAEFVPIVCEKFSIDPSQVSMYNVDVADRIMTFLPDKARNRAMNRLEKMGVKVLLKTNVTGVNPDSIEYETGGKPKTDTTHTVIWTAGIEGSDIAMKSEEALGHVERSRGRIQTDKYLRSVNYPNVYIAGDNIFYIPEGEKSPVPQMVENCEHCAPIIAANITSEIKGGKPVKEYKPSFHGAMVCIGGKYGTAYGGLPGRFFVQPSFFAMMAKHFINVVYFFQVLGWNKVFSYIKNEFFTIRNTRSFLGGHLSNRAPLFTLLPLRLFLGMYFIYGAYVRSVYNWLDEPLLYNRFVEVAGQFRPVFSIPGTTIAMDFRFWDTFRYSVSMVEGWSTMWFQAMPVSWFLQTYVVSTPGAEMFWQTVIVIFCILLGLAFIGGFMTTLASVGAVFYAVVLLLTVGIPFHTWWLFFAPIAFMFTGGKVLSLDYYFMPWLKRKWKNIGFVRKWYLYHD